MEPVRTVCIVDDDPIYQFATQKIIEHSELVDTIVTYPGGAAALAHLEMNARQPELLPDLLFLDINMPLMDGWEFLRHYAELKPRLVKAPVICMITSSTNPVDIQRAGSLSEVFDYVVKPLMPEKLEELVGRIRALELLRIRSAS